jgi:hypothetical protein
MRSSARLSPLLAAQVRRNVSDAVGGAVGPAAPGLHPLGRRVLHPAGAYLRWAYPDQQTEIAATAPTRTASATLVAIAADVRKWTSQSHMPIGGHGVHPIG